jgi:hypothetical protein
VQPGDEQSCDAALELHAEDKRNMVDLLRWQEDLVRTCRRKRLVLVATVGPRWWPQTQRYKLADLFRPKQ